MNGKTVRIGPTHELGDDEENRDFSRSRSRTERRPTYEARESLLEKALGKTSLIATAVGGFFKTGFTKIKDYVFEE